MELKKKGKEASFVGYEIPQRVFLSPTPFTVENELLTTTFKLKRHETKKYFFNEIKDLYDGAKLLGEE